MKLLQNLSLIGAVMVILSSCGGLLTEKQFLGAYALEAGGEVVDSIYMKDEKYYRLNVSNRYSLPAEVKLKTGEELMSDMLKGTITEEQKVFFQSIKGGLSSENFAILVIKDPQTFSRSVNVGGHDFSLDEDADYVIMYAHAVYPFRNAYKLP